MQIAFASPSECRARPAPALPVVHEADLDDRGVSGHDMLQAGTVDQGTPAWHDARRGRVTGTRAEKVMTRDLRTAIEGIMYPPSLSAGNPHLARGHRCEPLARDAFMAELRADPRVARATCSVPGIVLSPAMPRHAYSPDGIVTIVFTDGHVLRALLEIKAPVRRATQLHGRYWAQVQSGMLRLGLRGTFFVQYNERPDGASFMDHFYVPFDPAFARELDDALAWASRELAVAEVIEARAGAAVVRHAARRLDTLCIHPSS